MNNIIAQDIEGVMFLKGIFYFYLIPVFTCIIPYYILLTSEERGKTIFKDQDIFTPLINIAMCLYYFISFTIKSYKHIPYTRDHIVAFYQLNMDTFNTIKYPCHDVDKIIMYIVVPFLGPSFIKRLHRLRAFHHIDRFTTGYRSMEEAVLDWECSRYTKKDKQLPALVYICKSKKFTSTQRTKLLGILSHLHDLNNDILL